MRNGRVIVNGVDLYQTYGVLVARGGYAELVRWPSLKAVDGNDWQEEDGFEPDLSNIVLDSRTVNIKFVLKGGLSLVESFYRFLGSSPTMTYNFTDLGRTMTLRLVSMPSFEYARTFHMMQCQFAADTPLEGYTYLKPQSSIAEDRSVVIDDTPISDYGVKILKGTVAGVAVMPEVKPLLLRGISTSPGASYDEGPLINDPDDELGEDYEAVATVADSVSGKWKRSKSSGMVTYKDREITLSCFLESSTIKDAWRNYDALLYDLARVKKTNDPTQGGARRMKIQAIGRTLLCYYKSQEVTDFILSGTAIWLKFNITMRHFGNLADKLLGVDGRYILLPSGRGIRILS